MMQTSNVLRAKKMGSKASATLYKVFRLLLLIGLSYIVIYPILSLFLGSITLPEDLMDESRAWLPKNPTFTNYVNSFSYFKFFKHAGITLQIAGISTLIQLIVCSLIGYGLARYSFVGNSFLFGCVVFTIIMPIQTALLPMYLDYMQFDFFGIGQLIGVFTGTPYTVNLTGTKWVYYLPAIFGVGFNSGLFIFLFRQFFKGMPKDLEDAGKVDGCNPFMIYLRIMVPNTKPVFVTVALLSYIYYWNDTTLSNIMMMGTNDKPRMLYVKSLMASAVIRHRDAIRVMAENQAIALMCVAPLLLLFIIGQRFFIESMDRTGIKG
ncbi:MAG: carbohydrate ABC transporter permease [Lachnospiraceae bacterium]|nr:carbohydrate ABC transporter permease [Lachnospiraceae bacterium]